MASLCIKMIVDLFSKYPGSLVARKPCKSRGEARLRIPSTSYSIRSKLLSEFYVSDIVAVSTPKSFYELLSPALGAPMPRSLFSSAGTTSKNASLDEYTVDVRDLTRWSLPKVPSKHIYDLGSFTLAWSHLVKTLEQTITVEDTEQALELFSESDILPFREKYKFLHIGCVQIALKPLTLKGLNTSLMLSLRDARCLNWADSLMGVMETSLTNGPVYFNIYPDLALSMTDPHLLKALSLNLVTHNYAFRPGAETIAIVYRIYYGVKPSSLPKRPSLGHSNILSTKWREAIPRTQIVRMRWSDADGNVEITFAPNLNTKNTFDYCHPLSSTPSLLAPSKSGSSSDLSPPSQLPLEITLHPLFAPSLLNPYLGSLPHLGPSLNHHLEYPSSSSHASSSIIIHLSIIRCHHHE
ncbi:hypothetical protein H6P81_017381 [Aristolochia fimbriata]|uniref:A to I editase domain-containing protein n=1 Tax=Aristolochia fimbriata TaxID=158543 RepID=A0AAV7E115_ARIFI|nr:hypothetical protein H6P81_017381 [Aristolochia fimbriata]